MNAGSADALVARLRDTLAARAGEPSEVLVHERSLEAQPAALGVLRPHLPAPLARALVNAGIRQLYAHQVATVEALREGRNVVLASPPKDTRTFETKDGPKEFVLEEAIVADFGLVRAAKGDRHGNLVYRDSARNFNPLAAMCGRVTIAEVEELVEPGDLDPNEVHTPGVFVQRVVPLTPEQAADKRIEKRTVRTRQETAQ